MDGKITNAAHNKRSALAGILSACTCEVLFGLSYVFTKHAAGAAGPLALLGWRFFAAFAAMSVLAAARIVKINLKGKGLTPLLAIALCNPVIYFVCETFGIHFTTAAESAAFLACIPAASLACSAVVLRKKPRKRQSAGIAITLCGVLLTVGAAGASVRFSALGYAVLCGAVIAYALYSAFTEKAESFSEMEITFVMLAAGAAVFAGAAVANAAAQRSLMDLASLPFREPAFAAAVLYQGIGCSVFAFFLSNAAIARIGVNGASAYIGVSTAVSILAGSLFLQEELTPFQICGVILILTGVFIANRKLLPVRPQE